MEIDIHISSINNHPSVQAVKLEAHIEIISDNSKDLLKHWEIEFIGDVKTGKAYLDVTPRDVEEEDTL